MIKPDPSLQKYIWIHFSLFLKFYLTLKTGQNILLFKKWFVRCKSILYTPEVTELEKLVFEVFEVYFLNYLIVIF